MKKQFFRVKQLADQTFLRADKSEVLNNEELHVADQKVEYLRAAIGAVTKKLSTGSQGIDIDKRVRKTLEYQIGSVFLDQSKSGKHEPEQNGRSEEECQLFQQILRNAGEVELDLAKDYADHEVKVEEMVAGEFQKVLDVEFPNIAKQKRNLSKYLLDLDSATNRYQSTKKEALKGDMEEADIKVEQSRDLLATEMFSLLSRENDFAGYILQFLKLQRGYHESALKNLERLIPELEQKIGNSSIKKVFGVPLQEHLRVTGKRLAYPLEICIAVLSEYGMNEEGIFRMAGAVSKVRRLKAAIDSGCFTELIPEYKDCHVIASTMKMYLRELPEPLLTYTLHKEWVECMHQPEQHKLDAVKATLSKLPPENYDNLSYLIQFLARLSQHTDNKMSSSNIAIVMAPNLLWDMEEETNMNMGNCATINMLVEFFIKEVHALFPEDVSKYSSLHSATHYDERSNSHYGKLDNEHVDFNVSSESIIVTDSPKPNSRKKKPAAPVPPNNISKTDQDITTNRSSPKASSYPSGSTTLQRPNKPREPNVAKTSVAVNTTENSLSLSRGKNTSNDDATTQTHNKNNDISTAKTLVNPTEENVTHKYVTQPAANVQISKAKPVQPLAAQHAEGDKNYKTTAVHQIGPSGNGKVECRPLSKPVAAPRSIDGCGLNRTPSLRTEAVNKAQTEMFGDVQIRRPEALERCSKPVIPARPASLQKRSSVDTNVDPSLQRTQCSVYSVAHKQQPSIVNLHNRTEKYQPGHDSQMAEKERFLGHQPDRVVPLPRTSLENKFNDINSNANNVNNSTNNTNNTTNSLANNELSKKPPVGNHSEVELRSQGRPPRPTLILNNTRINEKLNMSKSNEKLNDTSESLNGNPRASHTRTRSDGNLIELVGENMLRSLHTPASPKSLNKPTQPPPPPPVTVIKIKEPESTDL